MKKLFSNKSSVVGFAGALLVILLAVIGPYITPFDPERPTTDVILPPSARHLFGTDASGLDVFSVTIAAFRVDITIALVGVGISFVLGVLLGAVTGFAEALSKGWRAVAAVIDAVLDVFQSLPVTIFALALVAVFGRDVGSVIAAITFVMTPQFARLVRSALKSVVNGGLVASCKVLGLSPSKTLVVHALPNSLSSATAYISVAIGMSVLLVASLSFLGAGVRPPTPEWGYIMSMGANYVATGQWWVSVLPGLVLSVTVVMFALAGDAITSMLGRQRKYAVIEDANNTLEGVGR